MKPMCKKQIHGIECGFPAIGTIEGVWHCDGCARGDSPVLGAMPTADPGRSLKKEDKMSNENIEITEEMRQGFATIRVLEHPVTMPVVNPNGSYTAEDIAFPEGWELIHAGMMDKMFRTEVKVDGRQKTLYESLKIPFYIVGRRRDDYVEDLRSQIEVFRANGREVAGRAAKLRQENGKRKEQLDLCEEQVADVKEANENLNAQLLTAELRYRKLEEGMAVKDAEIERLAAKVLAQ